MVRRGVLLLRRWMDEKAGGGPDYSPTGASSTAPGQAQVSKGVVERLGCWACFVALVLVLSMLSCPRSSVVIRACCGLTKTHR